MPPLPRSMNGVPLHGEDVAGVHHLEVAEHHERVAVGVRRAEVVEVDRLVAVEHRQLVGVGLVGQRVLLGAPANCGIFAMLGLGVGVGHDLDRGREEVVAAGVVAVRMGVDDVRHRLVGDRLHLVQDRLAPVGQLGVDEHDAVGSDEHGGVAGTTAGHHVEVVLHLLDGRDVRPGGRLLGEQRPPGDGHHGHDHDRRQHQRALHAMPSGKKTRWTNQKAPASATTTEPTTAIRRAATGR